MAVVLRLQGLTVEAGSEDIRKFFHGLPIPEGGVHITGGKLGEAFIIFNTERAGQLAMLHSGDDLRGSPVTLHKSSMAEFKHKLELKLRKRKCAPADREPLSQTAATRKLCTALQSLVAAVQELRSNSQMNQAQSPPVSIVPQLTDKDAIEERPVADKTPPVNNRVKPTKQNLEGQRGGGREVNSCKPGYLRIYGLPNTITKKEVCRFLEGLKVVDVITDTLQGPDGCCLVKMASFKEAEEGLKYSHSSEKDSHVEVRLAHERMWENAMEHHENSLYSTFSEQDRVPPDMHLHRNSPVKRPCSFSESPKRRRSNSPSFDTEYCVMVKNLPKTITKTELRNLFSCPDVPNSKILHLLDKWKERTSTAFILFTQAEEYTLAMNMNGSVIGSQIIDVSSITKEKMKDLMYQNRCGESERSQTCSVQARPVLPCIYARNFPAAVRKAEVKDFFRMYDINEEDITLLEDENGERIGEAVIQFGCEERARKARSLHGERFREDQILLTCISTQQMKNILHKTR
ncbi:RNA binding motif protein 12Ba [Neoarius graeffei]|uniref:RNA binding motif protein 12Ba n=1 Tax=Neoarius graeffei TaxID=443677 RepID=UPI00298D0D92|nr:RNA binding motif protein 12Ba [Neoarius graeffei]